MLEGMSNLRQRRRQNYVVDTGAAHSERRPSREVNHRDTGYGESLAPSDYAPDIPLSKTKQHLDKVRRPTSMSSDGSGIHYLQPRVEGQRTKASYQTNTDQVHLHPGNLKLVPSVNSIQYYTIPASEDGDEEKTDEGLTLGGIDIVVS